MREKSFAETKPTEDRTASRNLPRGAGAATHAKSAGEQYHQWHEHDAQYGIDQER